MTSKNANPLQQPINSAVPDLNRSFLPAGPECFRPPFALDTSLTPAPSPQFACACLCVSRRKSRQQANKQRGAGAIKPLESEKIATYDAHFAIGQLSASETPGRMFFAGLQLKSWNIGRDKTSLFQENVLAMIAKLKATDNLLFYVDFRTKTLSYYPFSYFYTGFA